MERRPDGRIKMATVISSIGGKKFKWTFGSDASSVFLGEYKHVVDIQKISPDRYSILLDGKSYQAIITRNEFTYSIVIHGKIYRVEVEGSAKERAGFGLDAGVKDRAQLEVRSPMPGMVVRCEVREGSIIEVGGGLLILEAMKMENEIRATRSGIIKKIHVREKQVVDKGALLITME